MAINLSASVWLYFTVINYVQMEMHQMSDPTDHNRVSGPDALTNAVATIVYLSLNKAAILNHVRTFDRIVPSLRGLLLTPYAVHLFLLADCHFVGHRASAACRQLHPNPVRQVQRASRRQVSLAQHVYGHAYFAPHVSHVTDPVHQRQGHVDRSVDNVPVTMKELRLTAIH